MKKYLLIALCLICGLCVSSATNSVDEEKIVINISYDKDKDKDKYNYNHRSIPLIEAYLFCSSQTVEVNIGSLESANVYIVNSNQQIVDYLFIDSNNGTNVIELQTNGPGDYLLIIESDDFYAEGMFTI